MPVVREAARARVLAHRRHHDAVAQLEPAQAQPREERAHWRQPLGRREARKDVDRHASQPLEHAQRLGPVHGLRLEQRLRPGVVAVRLDRHQLARQLGDRGLHLRRVDGERAVRGDPECPRVEQAVELQRLAAAVRLVDAEADRAEGRREERRVHRALEASDRERPCPRAAAAPTAPRCRPSPPRSPSRGPSARAAPWCRGRPTRIFCGPRPCISSCIRMWVKNASKSTLRPVGGRERHLRDRHEHRVELRVLRVLQHHPLAALLGDDALVVRQVVGGRLHAAVAVARREDDVDDADRRERAELRVAQRRLDRQAVLEPLQLGGEPRELRRSPPRRAA